MRSKSALRLWLCATAIACSGPTRPTGLACLNPAPLQGERVNDVYIVQLRAGVDPNAESTRLASKYHFTLSHVYTVIPGFAAPMPDAVAVSLRCEPIVAAMSHDQILTTN